MDEDPFITSRSKLSLTDAVAGIIEHEDGRYLMQLRDMAPDIAYPGHWGLFGGTVDDGEKPLDALRRELWEELEFSPRAMTYFARFDFDLSALGLRKCYRSYYLVPLNDAELTHLRLHEGSQIKLFAAAEILTHGRVAPYDAYALWLYSNRERFTV